MEEQEHDQYCFQDSNSSCMNATLSTSVSITVYLFCSLISAVTVFLNLLVIISISHFKQLHTPTNLLILSLAVSDFVVGLIVIPSVTVAIMQPCWVVGKYFCALLMYISFLCCSLSLGNLVLISIDRYVAVCNPLMYHSKITKQRIKFLIAINWCCCMLYQVVLVQLYVNINAPSRCFEECYFVDRFIVSMIMDFVLSFFVPCSIIIILYLKIFVVARNQARKVFSKRVAKSTGVKTVQVNNSELKAAKTLSIVVFNYLMCWIPLFFFQLVYKETHNSYSAFMAYLLFVNSLINPIIYAFFYTWFKVTAKHILTLKLRLF